MTSHEREESYRGDDRAEAVEYCAALHPPLLQPRSDRKIAEAVAVVESNVFRAAVFYQFHLRRARGGRASRRRAGDAEREMGSRGRGGVGKGVCVQRRGGGGRWRGKQRVLWCRGGRGEGGERDDATLRSRGWGAVSEELLRLACGVSMW